MCNLGRLDIMTMHFKGLIALLLLKNFFKSSKKLNTVTVLALCA